MWMVAALAVVFGGYVMPHALNAHAAGLMHPGGSGQASAVAVAVGSQYVVYAGEVREGGSVSWRARNPGNIRDGSHYGAVGAIRTGSNGEFAIFPSEAAGMKAIVQVLHRYGHVTVAQAMAKYAPADDNNDPAGYAAKVAAAMGVPVGTYVDRLTDKQLGVYAEAIKEAEGWLQGETYKPSDRRLPLTVRLAAQRLDHG